MANEEDRVLWEKLKGDPYWGKLLQQAEAFAGSLVVSAQPYRTLARADPHWNDVIAEFVSAAAAIPKEGDPKAEEAAWPLRYQKGSRAASRFYYNQVRKRRDREYGFSSDRAKAFLGIPARAAERGGDEPANGADLVADAYVDPLDRMARQEMVDAIREAIGDLPASQRDAVRLHGGLGDVPELDGYEPRNPNEGGSGGARGMRNVEIAPVVGKSERHVGTLLKKARSAIREALLEKWDVEDVREYFPNLCVED